MRYSVYFDSRCSSLFCGPRRSFGAPPARAPKASAAMKRMAAEIADQGSNHRRRARHRPVVVNARDGLHAPAVAPQPHAVDALGASDVGRTEACVGMFSSAGSPHGMLATHSASPSVINGLVNPPSTRSHFARCRTPVMSQGCDSLKSVVMFGCMSGEPSAARCSVSASLPSGRRAGFPFDTAVHRARRSAESASEGGGSMGS